MNSSYSSCIVHAALYMLHCTQYYFSYPSRQPSADESSHEMSLPNQRDFDVDLYADMLRPSKMNAHGPSPTDSNLAVNHDFASAALYGSFILC